MLKCTFFFLICLTHFLSGEDAWISYKEETLLAMKKIPGWCSDEKASLIMDTIHKNKCEYCIEIGVFAGRSLLPIGKALQYRGSGKVFGIDSWDPVEATEGFESSDPNFTWWSGLDYGALYKQTVECIKKNKLDRFCCIIHRSSKNAAEKFIDETVDFLHLDGNHNGELSLSDVVDFFPKVKNGGFILLSDPNWLSMKQTLIFLLERTEIMTPFSPSATYFLFRKNNQRLKNATLLME